MPTNLTDTFYAGDAFVGYGSQLLVGDGLSPETFEAVADVVEITPGDGSTGVVDKTHLRSPDRHREKLLTIRDSGAFQVKANWRPGHESQSNAGGGSGSFGSGGMMAIWRACESRNFIIRTPSAVGIDIPFSGGVTKYQIGGLVLDQKVDVSMEITPLNGAFWAEMP